MSLEERFEQFSDQFLKFERIEVKLNRRPDLHAFLLLDSILPGDTDMVSSAEHDEIWLEVDCDELEKVITDAQIMDLVRCGVRYSDESLCMFV